MPVLSNLPWRFPLFTLTLAGLVVGGCSAQPSGWVLTEDEVNVKTRTDNSGRLINEGGPVFAMPGKIILPTYYAGGPEGVTISAERLNGTSIRDIPEVKADADGNFKLCGYDKKQDIFFATAVVSYNDALHRVRALVKPEDGASITIDTASTLITAKLKLAAAAGGLAPLAPIYGLTTEVTEFVRLSVEGDVLRGINLGGSNTDLSARLNELGSLRPGLDYKVHDWEEAVYKHFGAALPGTTPTTVSPSRAPDETPLGEPPK